MFLVTDEIRSPHIISRHQACSMCRSEGERLHYVQLNDQDWPWETHSCRNMDWTSSTGQNQLTSVTAEEKISIFCGNYQENAPIVGIVLILCVILWFNYRNVSHFIDLIHWLFWRWWQMFLFICLYVWSKYTNKTRRYGFVDWSECTLETLCLSFHCV